jgi:hypothetical protein
VNAILRGWTNYFRYAHNAPQRFRYLTGVVYWLGAHFLGRKHRRSIKRMMRTAYGVDPASGKQALYTTGRNGKRVFIWNQPPKRCSVFSSVVKAKDVEPLPISGWAEGRSYEQRMEITNRLEKRCEHCGVLSESLIVHHPNRLGKRPKRKLGPANIIQSGQEQKVKLICPECHKQHHPGGWNGKQAETVGNWQAGCSEELPAQF